MFMLVIYLLNIRVCLIYVAYNRQAPKSRYVRAGQATTDYKEKQHATPYTL